MVDAFEAEELAGMYRRGWSIEQISIKYRRSRLTVARVLKAEGVKLRAPAERHYRKPNPKRDQIVARMADLYRQGWTIYQLSSSTGYAPQSVWRLLRASGLTLRATGSKGGSCVDCGEPTPFKRRCPLHWRLNRAALNLKAVRKYNAKADREPPR